jgi:hypothetical protein
VETEQEAVPARGMNILRDRYSRLKIIFPVGRIKSGDIIMVKQSFSTGNRSIHGRTYGTSGSSGHMTDTEEPNDARMKLSPVITNVCISLLIMAFFAIKFHL